MRWLSRIRPAVWVPPLAVVAVILGVWQIVASASRYLLPPIGAVIAAWTASPGFYLSNTGVTLAEAGAGLGIGGGIAVGLAVAMSQWRVVSRAVLPVAVIINVTPLLAIAPALSVALGIGSAPKVALTALITFFPVLINTLAGLRGADPDALDVLRSLRASRREILWRLQLPAALPYLFAALRVVVPLAVVGAAIAEMVAISSNGIGTYISQFASGARLAALWAAIATLVAVGLLLTGLLVALERRILHWRGYR